MDGIEYDDDFDAGDVKRNMPPDLPENRLAIVPFLGYPVQKEQPNVVRE